jgi:competence protein ComFC
MQIVEIALKIINYLYPPRCIMCKDFVQEENGICATCWNELSFLNSPFCNICSFEFDFSSLANQTCLKCISKPPKYNFIRSALKFNEKSKKLLHEFKYYDNKIIGEIFAKLIANKYKNSFMGYDFIIPVPMHKIKRIMRLYNQAQIFGESLSKIISVPIKCDVLTKVRNTKSQTGLSKKERKKNLIGTIEILNKIEIKDKNIILVDDVITTGSTISLCVDLLKKHGAKNVCVISIAKT